MKHTANFGTTNSGSFVGSASVDDSHRIDGYTGNVGNDEYELHDIFHEESNNLSTNEKGF